jgi:hypothetical protein
VHVRLRGGAFQVRLTVEADRMPALPFLLGREESSECLGFNFLSEALGVFFSRFPMVALRRRYGGAPLRAAAARFQELVR